jgi:thioredoxin 1
MQPTSAMTIDDFNVEVSNPGMVFLDFWASWCGPCRAFAPIFQAAAERNPDIVWGKIDVDSQPDLAGVLEIRSIPTLMVFRDGILLFERAGVLSAAALDQLVAKVRALDMEELRRRVDRPPLETPATSAR